jgi:hypothetical protein
MRLEILLIAADPGARDFVLRYVGRHRVTVTASSPEATTLMKPWSPSRPGATIPCCS